MLWEMLMLEGLQAGLAWIIVPRKRDSFRAACWLQSKESCPIQFNKADVERLMADAGIIRAQAKIAATIRGTQMYCEMEDQEESLIDFC